MNRPLALIAIVTAAATVAYLIDLQTSPLVFGGGLVGLVTFTVGILTKQPALCSSGLGIFLAGYALVILTSDTSIVRAAFFSGLFLGLCELGFSAIEQPRARPDLRFVALRLGVILLMVTGASATAIILVVAGYYVSIPSPWTTLLGLLSFVGLGAVGAQALRRLLCS